MAQRNFWEFHQNRRNFVHGLPKMFSEWPTMRCARGNWNHQPILKPANALDFGPDSGPYPYHFFYRLTGRVAVALWAPPQPASHMPQQAHDDPRTATLLAFTCRKITLYFTDSLVAFVSVNPVGSGPQNKKPRAIFFCAVGCARPPFWPPARDKNVW